MQNYDKKAMIFDIQKSSFVDGPGIRTTVFFKGCNLDCIWCHNPESKSFEKQIMYYKNKCVGCKSCVNVCPQKAISDDFVTDYSKCVFCGKCEEICLKEARKVCGMDYTEEELFEIINKDKIFYENSGGGVTFSGGECMLYPNELEKILKRCKENKIHTAVDTAGCVPWGSFEKILPYTDLFLYDIKTLDSEVHKKYTGVGNELILENLKRLFEAEANVWIRIPVIPGVNDSKDDMLRIKKYLSSYKPKKIELLPYHRMGENKYDALNMVSTLFDVPDNLLDLKSTIQ